jgi:hypothetical protein
VIWLRFFFDAQPTGRGNPVDSQIYKAIVNAIPDIIMKRKRSPNILAVQFLVGFQAALGTMAACLGMS